MEEIKDKEQKPKHRDKIEALDSLSVGISMVAAIAIGVGIGLALKHFTGYNIDLSELIDLALKYGKPNTNILDMGAFTEDTKDFFLMNNIGIDKLKQLQAVSLLWIILIEKK